jgi:hypothetical protein
MKNILKKIYEFIIQSFEFSSDVHYYDEYYKKLYYPELSIDQELDPENMDFPIMKPKL